MKKEDVRQVVQETMKEERNKFREEIRTALHDISYRMNQFRELTSGMERKIQTADMNVATHMFDGFVFTDDTPTAGSVAWTDLHISYKGQTYQITDGDTADKYLYWMFGDNLLTTSNTKPSIGTDDVLIGVNDEGTFYPMMSGKMGHGAATADGSINTGELSNNAVTRDILAQFAVDADKLDSNAVTGDKIQNSAVTGLKIDDNAVTEGKIDNNAVSKNKLQNSSVDGDKLEDGAVGGTKLADGGVTGPKLGAGSVAEDKLNTATHFLF